MASTSTGDSETLRISEVFTRPTVQGEGPYVGQVCTFVRLYGCNLHCRWCDTPFTWDEAGLNGTVYRRDENMLVLPIDDIAARVVEQHVPLCVVSGGEPMLQAHGVEELARRLYSQGVATHVETNGTRPPPTSMTYVEHFTVSPKLPSANAGPNALPMRTLALWAHRIDAVFKTVCSTVDDVEHANELYDALGVPPRHRWVMPEGKISPDVTARLGTIVDAALHLRLNISPRFHVDLWGNERSR